MNKKQRKINSMTYTNMYITSQKKKKNHTSKEKIKELT